MRKLIKVISRKFLHPRKSELEDELKLEKKFLSFMFRKQKLKKKFTLKSFSKYQDYAGQSVLATSNFQGSEFVIKQSANQFSCIKQELQLEQNNTQNQNQRSIQKLYDEPTIPDQVKDRFHQTISQSKRFSYLRVNHIVRELYFQKKKLMESTPFEWNISLTLWILFVFVLGLIIFEFHHTDESQSEKTEKQKITYSYAFCSFLVFLVFTGFSNLIYVLCKPYKPFNFDYHVIQKVSKKLMEENKYFFDQKNYALVCDIQMTWILLKPKDQFDPQAGTY